MEVGAPLVSSTPLRQVAARFATAPAAVAVVVALSSVLQTLMAWRRPTPGYFPDEYMYAELGRSLLDGGSPLVRGESANFLPLLYPLLTAPAWLWDDVEHAYRTIQAFNAVAISLAAVPAFLLARRIGVGTRLAVAVAGLAVVVPDVLYSSAVMAEPLAYPLALGAAAAAVATLERPTVRLQLAFLGLAGLAAATRIQLAVLPLCYLAAVVAVGRRDRRLQETLRDHRVGTGVTALGLLVGVAAALSGKVGIYGDLTAYSVDLGVAAAAAGANALVLAYAAGWVLVPGALLGLGLALARPRSRAELGFGAFALVELVLLLVQASVVGDMGRVQERYAMYALPLLGCLFALYASRGWPLLRAHALLAAVAGTAAAAVPLAGYAAGGGTSQSLVLAALRHLEGRVGDVGLASLAVAVGATALSGVVLAVAATRGRSATPVALALALAVSLGTTAAAFALQRDSRTILRAAFLPTDPSWVDAAVEGPVTLLVTPRSTRADLHSTLFWNRSIRRLALLNDADRPDAFSAIATKTDGAGRLDLPPGPVLADEHGSTIVLRDATPLREAQTKTLWRLEGRPQLQLLLAGRYYSGLMAAEGGVRVWPVRPGGRLAAWLELELSSPRPVEFEVELPDGGTVARTISGPDPQLLRIPVCGYGAWRASWASGSIAVVHGTRVGVRSSEPRLVDDASACD